MEGCYNGFPTYGQATQNVFASDLCGYMYLFNHNKALLSQYATLGYNFGGPLLTFPDDALFKDLGLASDHGGMYTGGEYKVVPYTATTLYANMVCTYEHWLVSALLPPSWRSLALRSTPQVSLPGRPCHARTSCHTSHLHRSYKWLQSATAAWAAAARLSPSQLLVDDLFTT